METNRNYFSWSQYYLWNTSKKQYYKRYVLGEKSLNNKQFQKGREFGHYKETGEILHTVKNPDMLEVVGDAVPVLEIMEHEIKTEISFDDKKYDLLSYIDSGMENFEEFFEYKTGKEPWDQNRVDSHEQLDFYALCYYLKSDCKVIPKCKLYWIETENDDDENIVFTGNVEEFEREFTVEDLTIMLASIVTCLRDIEAYEYKELELENELVKRYKKISDEMKLLKEESDILRLQFLTEMNNKKVKYAESKYGSFSISERKYYSYPKEIVELEKKYKDEITKRQNKAIKKGDAKITVSESLRFNPKKN